MRQIILLLFLISFDSHSQIQDVFVREADVLWSKKIWRVIDKKQEVNTPLFFKNGDKNQSLSLFDIIKEEVLSGSLTAFKTDEVWDLFNSYSLKEINARLIPFRLLSEYEVNVSGDEFYVHRFNRDTIASSQIVQIWTLENWFFDKSRSVMDFRLIAIAPVVFSVLDQKNTPLFWIFYPDCASLLSNYSAIAVESKSEEISFDRVFRTRRYSARIIKESNLYGRSLEDYVYGQDLLIESDRIKERIKDFECDLWQW